MTDQELRLIVRAAIGKHFGASGPVYRAEVREASGGGRDDLSHAQFAVPSGPEGTCIIEPSVMCNHCGYCKSYGH